MVHTLPAHDYLILKMLHALRKADDFMTGFEDDTLQEDMSGLDAVRFAITAAEKYLSDYPGLNQSPTV